MLSIFLAYSLAIEMLSSFSGGHFLEVSRNIKDIKPISITFDDGPHRIRTMKILDILKSEDVPATFFVVGNRVTKEWDILRRMVREWYKIGNHSFSHPQFPKLWWGKIMEEVIFTNISIWLQTWEYPKYFRFPYGLGDKRVSLFFGGKNIGWNVDGNDWKEKNPKRLVDTIINQTRSGSIILLHDIKEDTVQALPLIIKTLKSRWYTFVSLDVLLPKQETKIEKKWIWVSATKNIPIQKTEKKNKGSGESVELNWRNEAEGGEIKSEWKFNF